MITQLELGITDGVSVSLVSINVWGLAGDTLKFTCNFLYCNHQVHRDFLITLYILDTAVWGILFGVRGSLPVAHKFLYVTSYCHQFQRYGKYGVLPPCPTTPEWHTAWTQGQYNAGMSNRGSPEGHMGHICVVMRATHDN
jgi:hypothetical protein